MEFFTTFNKVYPDTDRDETQPEKTEAGNYFTVHVPHPLLLYACRHDGLYPVYGDYGDYGGPRRKILRRINRCSANGQK